MMIPPVYQLSFGYKSILKTEWLKGNMPDVEFDMGGNRLTKDNVTNGHMLAVSKGGKTCEGNLMLETANYNFMKSNKPFSWFFTKEGFDTYCEQFKKVKLPNFNGMDYIYKITKNADFLLKNGK